MRKFLNVMITELTYFYGQIECIFIVTEFLRHFKPHLFWYCKSRWRNQNWSFLFLQMSVNRFIIFGYSPKQQRWKKRADLDKKHKMIHIIKLNCQVKNSISCTFFLWKTWRNWISFCVYCKFKWRQFQMIVILHLLNSRWNSIRWKQT